MLRGFAPMFQDIDSIKIQLNQFNHHYYLKYIYIIYYE
jgi:hypothetical protein